MNVSILIATYNRVELLRRALASVLAQDYPNLNVVVVDDYSTDGTRDFMLSISDPRVRYVRNSENVGSKEGDVAIIRRFLSELCTGEAFCYLCDDDYWPSTTLISRQVAALEAHRSLSFVQGGMAHCYPQPVPGAAANETYLRYEFLDEEKTQVFWGNLYPAGFMTGREFLRLFSEDPKNRNIVMGAVLYRTAPFRASGIMERICGVRWQAGFAIVCGAAVYGDVFYIDAPELMVAVRTTTASHSGTQAANYRESLASIDAAFGDPPPADLLAIRNKMMMTVMASFLCNKIAHRAGWFDTNTLGNISAIFEPPIKGSEFIGELMRRGVPLSENNRKLIDWSDKLPMSEIKECTWWQGVLAMAS